MIILDPFGARINASKGIITLAQADPLEFQCSAVGSKPATDIHCCIGGDVIISKQDNRTINADDHRLTDTISWFRIDHATNNKHERLLSCRALFNGKRIHETNYTLRVEGMLVENYISIYFFSFKMRFYNLPMRLECMTDFNPICVPISTTT